jgi:hypothetical protein
LARLRRWSNGQSPERLRFEEAIAHCGELRGIGRRCRIAERRVRASLVVVGDPSRERGTGMLEAKEQGLVQELV